MNKVMMIGYIVDKPLLKQLDNTVIANFSIAVNRRLNREITDFFNCISFEKTAEFANKYLTKGMKVAIYGELQSGSYVANDGHNVYFTKILVQEFEFAGANNIDKKNLEEPFKNVKTKDLAEPEEVAEKLEKDVEIDSDDLPF